MIDGSVTWKGGITDGFPQTSLVITLMILLPAGCAEDSPRAAADSLAEEVAPTVVAEETWRSSDRLLLSGVTDLAVDSRSRVYLADRDAGIILLSSTGDSLRSIGGKGGGPGEYEFIASIQVIDGDSLLVYDPVTRRVSVFEPDSGAFAYAHTFFHLPEQQWIPQLARVRGRALYLAIFPSRSDQPGDLHEGPSIVRLLDEQGRIVRDSLLVFPPGQDLVVTEESGGKVRRAYRLGNFFGWQPTVRLKPDRIYYGRSDSLAIHVYDLEGNRIGGFSKSVTSRTISDEEVERQIEEMRDQDFSGQLPAHIIEQWIQQLEENVPDNWPVYRTFLVDDERRFWILPRRIPDDDRPPPWRVYSPDGQLIGKVEGVFPQAFAGGKAYATQYDSLGVPSVIAYQIPDFAAATPTSP